MAIIFGFNFEFLIAFGQKLLPIGPHALETVPHCGPEHFVSRPGNWWIVARTQNR